MSETDAVVLLRQENERLKRENEMLMETVRQIRKTINRLIDRYVDLPQAMLKEKALNRRMQNPLYYAMVMQAVVSQQLIPAVDGGVVPAFEVMFFNNAIRNLIRESKIHQIDNIIATSQEEGMITMDNSIIKLFREGKISKENAIIYSSNGELMEKKLARL